MLVTSIFSFSHNVLKKHFSQDRQKSGWCGKGITLYKAMILEWSKFEAFAPNNINVNQKLKFALECAENIVGKGQNTILPAIPSFPTMFFNGNKSFLSKGHYLLPFYRQIKSIVMYIISFLMNKLPFPKQQILDSS